MCGVIVALLLVAFLFQQLWPWLLAAIVFVTVRGLYLGWKKVVTEQQEQTRLHAAALPHLIARRQRDIARSDAELGLSSAPLSAVNAATLEHLANLRR